MNILLIK